MEQTDNPNDTQPVVTTYAAQLYKAANRIANLEYQIQRLEIQRDGLIDVIKDLAAKM